MGAPFPGGEKSGGKEDTLSVLQEFFVWVLAIQPEEVPKIEFQWVHRVGKTNVDWKPHSIIVRFLRYQDGEFIFSKMSLLRDSQFDISVDLPKEIVKRCKDQVKKLIEARRSSKLAFFSRAEPDKLYIDRVLVPLWTDTRVCYEIWLSCYLRSFPIVIQIFSAYIKSQGNTVYLKMVKVRYVDYIMASSPILKNRL